MVSKTLKYPELKASSIKTSNDPESLESRQFAWEKNNNTYFEAQKALKKEKERVNSINNRVASLSNELSTSSSSYEKMSKEGKTGMSSLTFDWLNKDGLLSCNSASCSTGRKAGIDVPNMYFNEKTDTWEKNEFNMDLGGTKSFKGGDQLPTVPGNIQFDNMASRFGFRLEPKNTIPSKGGQFIRSNYDAPTSRNNPTGRGVSSTGHSIVAGFPVTDDRGIKTMTGFQNSGGVIKKGISETMGYSRSELFDNTDQDKDGRTGYNRVMTWEGNIPYKSYQSRMADKARNYGTSPQQKDFMQRMKNTKPVIMGDAKITGNTKGLNLLFKKLKKK
jgi:hypothetical protein